MNIELLHTIFLAHPEVTTDSRNCPRSSMFFALKGDKFDGNLYAKMALDNGCAYAVVDNKEIIPSDDNRYILVHDVLATLQQLANYHRNTFDIPVIQITGTNGKTTTKELLSAVLSQKYNTLFTQGNLNNHIGAPRTLLRLNGEHHIAVIETGANHPGEIKFLSELVEPDYGLITNVGCAHLEGFGSFEGVKQTKAELYDHLKNNAKKAFINSKDNILTSLAHEHGIEGIEYANGEIVSCNPFLTFRWYCKSQGQWHQVQTKLIGSYNLSNLLSAITVGEYFGVAPEDINKALANYNPTNSRSEFRKTEHNSLIIDAYNANPTSMAAAIENFERIDAEQKMLILGEMRELGKDSTIEHQKIVDTLQSINACEIWLVGQEFINTNRSSLIVPHRVFANVEEVKDLLSEVPLSQRTLLIKGSNGTRLFELVPLL